MWHQHRSMCQPEPVRGENEILESDSSEAVLEFQLPPSAGWARNCCQMKRQGKRRTIGYQAKSRMVYF